MSSIIPAQLIRQKRDGGRLDDSDIRAFIGAVTDGSIPDYQIAAMLMAIYFRGLDNGELAVWADAMTHSGDVLDLSAIQRAKIDKHSTGGVGDKISIPLAPAVAACGVAVPMVSGRGLGHKLQPLPYGCAKGRRVRFKRRTGGAGRRLDPRGLPLFHGCRLR